MSDLDDLAAAGRATGGAPYSQRRKNRPSDWHPGVAAVLSLVIPGAGQMYKGHVLRGFLWLFAVVLGYVAFVVPGLVLHIACVFMAASGHRR